MKHLFSTAPEVKKRRRTEITGVTGRWTGCDLGMIGRVQSVFSVCVHLGHVIGRGGTSGRSWRLTRNNQMLAL
jgi:hypothetical protein